MTDIDREYRASFDNLLRPHLDRLYRFAWRLCDSKAEAEDLFQDVLTKVYARLSDLVEVQEPGTWLCRVMYNYFIDHRRRFARHRLISVDEAALPQGGLESFPGNLDPVADVEQLDTVELLHSALATLSEDHRLVVMLHDCEGYKLKEIQDITGDPVGTLKSRLHRARARLRELLGSEGTFSGS